MFTTIHHDLEGMAAERFRSLASHLRRVQREGRGSEQMDAICRDEMAWLQSAQGLNGCREKYEASARLLTDLAKLRWRIVLDGFSIELASPNERAVSSTQVPAYKESVRQELVSQIRSQFSGKPGKAARDFVHRMENPMLSSKKRSVLELIADGRELRGRLLAASEASGAERKRLCTEAVRPYLQLVESDGRDSFTGHTLSDIWRYFRYTWSIPATNVPGRNLFYLIRDAAHSSHAVMGITALSNTPLALRDRDNRLGWTAAATLERVRKLSALPEPEASAGLTALLADLETNIQAGFDAILHDQLLHPDEATNPTEEVIQRLRRKAAEFAEKRAEVLSEPDIPSTVSELEDMVYGEPEVSDAMLALEGKIFGNSKMDAARRALIAKKRAAELARLLQARLVLRQNRDRLISPAQAPAAYALEAVVAAVNTAWVSAKNARAGTSMMELTVCGAVRPYNHILGGKLAALLMLSPEVADDYTCRYGRSVSIISSMMKNEPVVKDTRLVFLGTTSLYLHGASQYNRVRLPAGVISPEQTEIRYEPMGETGGFGTVQFSSETVQAVEKVVTSSKGYREVNSIFGEGRSPKLRKLRTGLDEIGFDPEMLMQHQQRRLIYGVSFFLEVDEFLRTGRGELPDYISNPGQFRDATGRIANYWSKRWLSQRLNHTPLMQALAECPAWRLSQMLPVAESLSLPEASDEATHVKEPEAVMSSNNSPRHDTSLWKSLAAAGHSACSDCLVEQDLSRLHVPTPLDEFLVERVREGFSIVLTGNAGDGKTHLLRHISPTLEQAGALVDLDATAVMRKGEVAPILEHWRSALDAGRPYCLAANEYPLHLMIRSGRGILPNALYDELIRQTRQRLAYSYEPQASEEAQEKLLVVDLSLRNPLLPSFSLVALRRMLADPAVKAQSTFGKETDFSWNYRQLSMTKVQERLGKLFQRIADHGHRCTIRELWICLARLLFGDPAENADGIPPIGSPRCWYSSRLWSPPSSGIRFSLGELLLREADPAAISHPRWDARLERVSEMNASQWLSGIPSINPKHHDTKEMVRRFGILKRRFYFEHEHGNEVFSLWSGNGRTADFSQVLSGVIMADDIFKAQLLRAINNAYCPKIFAGSERELYLWFSHRYHEQPTRSYVASRSIPLANFSIRIPRLPARIAGAFDYRPDHLVLECLMGGQRTNLRIDAALHTTLGQLAAGFPRHLAPESELNKLDDYLSRLLLLDVQDTRQFLVYSAEARLATRITLDETFQKYLTVEKL